MQSIINIIDLVAIVVGATFGIIGTATETKSKNGNLTKWGKVAIIGIIITNLFSFLNSYFKQEKEYADKLNSERRDNELLKEQNNRFKEQHYNDSITLRKIDTSLDFQIILQNKSKQINNELISSIEIQKKLTESQKNISKNLNRSLNPLLPIGIKYTITLDLDEFALRGSLKSAIMKIDSLRKDRKNRFEIFNDKTGLHELFSMGESAPYYMIEEHYKDFQNFNSLLEIFAEIELIPDKILTTQNYLDSLNGGIRLEALTTNSKYSWRNYDELSDVELPGVRLYYIPEMHQISLSVVTTNVNVLNDEGKLKSIEDLKGLNLVVIIRRAPCEYVNIDEIGFLLPPNFSNEYNLPKIEFHKDSLFSNVIGYSKFYAKIPE